MRCNICKMGETSNGRVTVTLQRGELTVLSDDVTDQVLKQAEASAARNAEVEILRFAA